MNKLDTSQMKQLNEWSAKQCGVIDSFKSFHTRTVDGIIHRFNCPWNLEDARCMEVFREKFDMNTMKGAFDRRYAYVDWADLSSDSNHSSECGHDTIKDAELACAYGILMYKLDEIS